MEPLVLIAVAVIAAIAGAVVGMLARGYWASQSMKEAQAEAAEVLRINPKFSLEVHKQRVPIQDPAVLECHLAALRKA